MTGACVLSDNNKEVKCKKKIKVKRTFGTHCLSEIYSEYVAKQIRKTVKGQNEKKKEDYEERV